MKYQPVFVIGAARSGTRLVRDLIASHPQVDKIPYDINYVWRFGNEKLDHDELQVKDVSADVSSKIRKYFDKNHQGAAILIEKTVSNCLRVPAVDKVFPEACFISLYRNGWDVIESSYRQWIAPPDWRYILAKTRTYPFFQAFGYASNYGVRLFRRLFSRKQGSINTWGPLYNGIYTDIQSKSIIEVCAIQWSRCVSSALRDLTNLHDGRVYNLSYEDFILDPQAKLFAIAEFLRIDPEPYLNGVIANITPGNIGKGLRALSDEQKAVVEKYVEDTAELIFKSCLF
jgi:hypothetical protein